VTKRIKGGRDRRPIYSGFTGRLAQVVDATVGVLAPRLAHRLRQARVKSEALLAFEAARISRVNPATSSTSADSDVMPDLKRLRDLSRALVRDDAHVSSAVNVIEENVVGEGVRPQSICTPEATGMTPEQCQEWRAACEAEWERWAIGEADATRVGTFYDLQALVLRTMIGDGDAIGHLVMGGDGMIACELVDADRLESPGMIDTDRIRGGVELGPHGEQVAFHILPQHPDDYFLGSRASRNPVRIEAEAGGLSVVQHVFRRTRPGQTRGVPLVTSSMLYGRHLHHYLDSELIAARAASNYALFIKKAVSTTDQDVFPVQDSEAAGGQDYYEELQPGTIEYLNEGEEPVAFNPNRPGTAFAAFVERVLRAMAASMGLAYELVCKDFGRMNLSSARAVLRECRRGFDLLRRRMVRQFCAPWYSNVIRMAVQAGRIKPPGAFLDTPEAFLAARWVSPSYGMVDPVTDVEGSVAAISANLSTPYEEAARQGLDAEQVLRERARFLVAQRDIESEFGLEPGALAPQSAAPRATTTGTDSPDAPGAADPSDDEQPEPEAESEEQPEPADQAEEP
jgi:lambda family phage portal protein